MNLLCIALASTQLSSVSLSDLNLAPIHQGWGHAMKNRSVTDTVLSINGRKFDKGVGTHAISTFRIRLFGKATQFHALVGIDDNAKVNRASAYFHIIGDGKEIWKSPLMGWKRDAVEVNVSLKGIKTLNLTVDDAGDGIDYDHGDWADASIQFSGRAPETLVPPIEKEYILTPPPSPKPKINGPSRVGVRPGHPFLYTLPITGLRPMKLVVHGLPSGLNLNPSSGLITGRVSKAGTYPIVVTAKNQKGTIKRTIQIVCGDEIALTPQMGWNSWYIWLGQVNDSIMRQAADAMVRNGMIQHGWQYVNIDDCWARVPGSNDRQIGGPTRDAEGRIIPSSKFPNMKGLTDYIHSKGLKAGIYTSPGPTTCAGFEGALGHEAIDAKTFADWGYDLLKYDWCSYQATEKGDEGLKKPYRLMGSLLRQQNRDMVLNLCQYGMGQVWKWGKSVGGHSWRTAGDLGAGYTMYQDGFDLYGRSHLEKYAGVGAFNDPDYILVGNLAGPGGKPKKSPFTPNEQYSQMSFWCLVAAPLILGGDIATLDPFTLNLLTNDEVISVDQDSLVKAASRVAKVGESEVWARPLDDGSQAVGLFNMGEEEATVQVNWKDLGLKHSAMVRDLWRQRNLGKFHGSFSAKVPRHGVVMVKVIGGR